MRKWMVLALFLCLLGWQVTPVRAIGDEKSVVGITLELEATQSATPSATITPQEKKAENLTETEVSKPRLERLLDNQKVTGWVGFNILKLGIRKAVEGGVAANTIVLVLLFPLVAALVAFSRNVIGIQGFGVFMPAVLSVAFLSTGVIAGLMIFGAILVAATATRMMIRKWKMQFFPRMAILIWAVSLAVLALLMVSPVIRLEALMRVGIFPILLFILLAETFIQAQITRSLRVTLIMTLETIIVALVAYGLMSAQLVQAGVLLHPEITVLTILLVDFLIGRYSGLRFTEMWRFRELWLK